MQTCRVVRSLSLLALCGASSVACKPDALSGSGKVTSATRAVSGFNQVELATAGDLTITQSGTESLTIAGDDNLLPHFTSVVRGGVLVLDLDTPVRSSKGIRYTLTVKDLASIKVSGAGDVSATQLHVGTLGVVVSGAGDVTLGGAADALDVVVSGTGDCDATKLTSKTAKAVVSGTGSVTVAPTDSLDAVVSGMGDVFYLGSPKVQKQVSGMGDVKHK